MNTLEKTASLGASDLFLNNSAEALVASIKSEALEMVFDVTTAKGREACISHAAKVTKTKTTIEKLGKALVDPIKAQSKEIDKERKYYRDELEAIKAEVRRPVTLWEEEQAAAKAKVEQHFFELEQAGVSTSAVTGELLSEVQLNKKIAHLEGIDLADFGDRSDDAEQMQSAGLTRIKAALQQRKDADELAELRKLKAEREEKERREAEEKRIAEEAIAKHEAAKKESATVEVAKKPESATTEVAKKPDAKRQAMNAAYASLRNLGLSQDTAQMVVKAIQSGDIANVTLNV
jgi:hypothetical protein